LPPRLRAAGQIALAERRSLGSVVEDAMRALLPRRAAAHESRPYHVEVFDGGGYVVPHAYLAALAVEHDCEWVTADRGFARFPGLRWRHPLD
jgi:predicted nucleic acid-binding protein